MRVIFSLVCMFLASSASACTAVPASLWVDQPIEVASDGSFEFAESDSVSEITGGVIYDLGNQRVAQRITYGGVCGSTEYLLYSDCRTAEVVAARGLIAENNTAVNYGSPYRIDYIQAPLGALNVFEIDGAEEFVSIAYENGYRVQLNMDRWIAEMKPRNRFDPFNGCKIYYPDSSGARS